MKFWTYFPTSASIDSSSSNNVCSYCSVNKKKSQLFIQEHTYLIPTSLATMKMVGVLINTQLVRLPIYVDLTLADTIATTPYNAALEGKLPVPWKICILKIT